MAALPLVNGQECAVCCDALSSVHPEPDPLSWSPTGRWVAPCPHALCRACVMQPCKQMPTLAVRSAERPGLAIPGIKLRWWECEGRSDCPWELSYAPWRGGVASAARWTLPDGLGGRATQNSLGEGRGYRDDALYLSLSSTIQYTCFVTSHAIHAGACWTRIRLPGSRNSSIVKRSGIDARQRATLEAVGVPLLDAGDMAQAWRVAACC